VDDRVLRLRVAYENRDGRFSRAEAEGSIHEPSVVVAAAAALLEEAAA
jgi:hypothetical protein